MAAIRFFAPLALAAGAASAAHVQVPLHWPKPEAFASLATRLKQVEYPDVPFSGSIPWYTYAMDVSVGTPAQQQSMVLSLEAPESYVLWDGLCSASAEGDAPELACTSGSFDDEESETFNYNASATTYSEYVGGRVDGYLMYDNVAIGDASLRNATLELGIDTHLGTGIFGLANSKGYRPPYVRDGRVVMLDQMTKQGVIDSPAFSIWGHDSDNGTTGSILFGAVDKSRYNGKLQRVQASFALDGYAREYRHMTYDVDYAPGFFVNVSAAWHQKQVDNELSNPYMNYTIGANALLDPAGPFYAAIDPTYTFTNVPRHIMEPLLWNIKPSIWHNIHMYAVECDSADSLNGTLTLEIGGAGGYRLSANLRDLVVSAEDWFLQRQAASPGSETEEYDQSKYCLLALQSVSEQGDYGTMHQSARSGASQWVIGSQFLQNTYTVFDSQNMEVGLAPLKKSPGDKTDIVAFDKLGARIPDSDFVGVSECFDRCEPEEEEEDDNAGASFHPSRTILGVVVMGALGALAW